MKNKGPDLSPPETLDPEAFSTWANEGPVASVDGYGGRVAVLGATVIIALPFEYEATAREIALRMVEA